MCLLFPTKERKRDEVGTGVEEGPVEADVSSCSDREGERKALQYWQVRSGFLVQSVFIGLQGLQHVQEKHKSSS